MPSPPENLEALARELFGPSYKAAVRYAEILKTDGSTKGLIGPREVDRLWERHIINCALMVRQLDQIAGEDTSAGVSKALKIADIGSGAGLPGLVLAIARGQHHFTLIETMQRRANFLQETISQLGLENVDVVRSRAEEFETKHHFEVVTARAVAALDKLALMTLPLVKPGGVLLAMKGQNAQEEVLNAQGVLADLGIWEPGKKLAEVIEINDPAIEVATTLVQIRVHSAVQTGKVKAKAVKAKPKSSGRLRQKGK